MLINGFTHGPINYVIKNVTANSCRRRGTNCQRAELGFDQSCCRYIACATARCDSLPAVVCRTIEQQIISCRLTGTLPVTWLPITAQVSRARYAARRIWQTRRSDRYRLVWSVSGPPRRRVRWQRCRINVVRSAPLWLQPARPLAEARRLDLPRGPVNPTDVLIRERPPRRVVRGRPMQLAA